MITLHGLPIVRWIYLVITSGNQNDPLVTHRDSFYAPGNQRSVKQCDSVKLCVYNPLQLQPHKIHIIIKSVRPR